MKWLSKVAQIVAQGVTIIARFEGIIDTVVPSAQGLVRTISKDLSDIANVILQTEIIGQALKLVGADKLKAAAPAVEQIILSSSMLVNHKINDEALFHQGVLKVTDGMADILNSLHDNVEITNKS